MAAPYNNLRSKLRRAVAAYLIDQGCGGVDDVLPAGAQVDKPKYPLTIVKANISRVETPLTGIRRIPIHVIIKGSAVQELKEPNPERQRVLWEQRVAKTYDALLQSDDGQTLRATAAAITAVGRALAVADDPGNPDSAQKAANNSDMADFTCEAWYDAGEGDGAPDEDGSAWIEVLMFEAICSPSNVD